MNSALTVRWRAEGDPDAVFLNFLCRTHPNQLQRSTILGNKEVRDNAKPQDQKSQASGHGQDREG